MNPFSRPLIWPLVLTSGQASQLILGSLILCVSLLGATAVTFAQQSAPDQVSSIPPPVASPKNQNIQPAQAPQATPTSASSQVTSLESSQGTSKAQSDKDEFGRVKEVRLNELRYKHLWIAYSLVWLIVFIFIRGTWRRSQAVEQRIIDLQNRLSKLE